MLREGDWVTWGAGARQGRVVALLVTADAEITVTVLEMPLLSAENATFAVKAGWGVRTVLNLRTDTVRLVEEKVKQEG